MPTGPTPTAALSGNTVTLSWSAVKIIGTNVNVSSYIVQRFKGGVAEAIAGTCANEPTETSCTDSVTATGSYTYRMTPKSGTWTGPQGAASNSVDFSAEPPAATTMTASLAETAKTNNGLNGSNHRWSTTVTVTVVDNNGAPVQGAAVSGTWTKSPASGGNTTVHGPIVSSCNTSATGTCAVSSANMEQNVTSVRFVIDSITKSGLTYTAPSPKTGLTVNK